MAKYTEAEVDAFMRRFRSIVVVCVIALAAPLVIYALYLDRRLDSFENSLRFQDPHESGEEIADKDLEGMTLNPVQGQLVYAPAYSHVYHQDGSPHLLTITLSVRNTSVEHDIVLTSVRYYNTKGKKVRSHLDKPLRLAPLATAEFLVKRDDASGGSGASFLVEWVASRTVTEPMIETVMIDTSEQQGISFVRRGVVIKEKTPVIEK